jgi:transglutaminase-like putative cysteine protease
VVPIAAVIAGYYLARSRFSASVAFLISVVYGLFVIGLLSAMLLPAELPWHEKIPQLIARQADWLIKAANVILNPDAADTSRDGLIFVMQTGLILWAFGLAAAWYTFRRLCIWRAILPSGILLLITVANYYGEQPLGTVLVAFLFLALLYIVGSHYLVRERDWMDARVVFSHGTRLDFLQAGFLIALLTTPVAWIVPNVSAREALQDALRPMDVSWQRIHDGWTQLFASLKSYGGEYSDPYGKTLALGGPRQITPAPIMDVQASGGRYWRGTVYDSFTGDGWASTAETRVIVPPDRPLELPEYDQRDVITATFTSYLIDSGLIYFPHQPARTDQQARFTVHDLHSGSYDVFSALSRYVIYEGKSYQAWGSVSSAPDSALRRAGTVYPDWVLERYLELPSNSSPRIAELAAAIADPQPNPYDKAEALTGWLRANIIYNEAIEAPPPNTDALVHLLFESKEGYCTYYASALAVMLRSQGIPARVAAGYTRGTLDEERGTFRVYSTNAHTWVEVFFPRYGWVEFEPTAAQPAIVRTASGRGGTGQDGDAESERNLREERPLPLDDEYWRGLDELDEGTPARNSLASKLGLIVAGAVFLLVLVAAGAILLSDRRAMGKVSVAAQAYYRMGLFGRWLGAPLVPVQTPHERAAVLIGSAPEAAAPIDVITGLYVEERYGRVREGMFDERAGLAWRELRPALLRRILLRSLSRFQQRGPGKEPPP